NGNVSKFVYVNSRLEMRIEGANSYAYISDALGSSRFVLRNGVHDVANITYFALTYEPFGKAVGSEGFDRITFASEVRDSTGLVYLGARYYDPILGRFMALDPLIGEFSAPQTLDRYVYCANSPLIHTDPTGKALNFLAAAVGAVAGGIIGGAIAYVTTGGDMQATGAAMLGGMVAGGIAGLTMGASLLPAAGVTTKAMIFGFASGAAGGAVENGLKAGAKSKWNAKKMIEEANVGAIVGGATGFVSGGLSTKLLHITKLVPKGEGVYGSFQTKVMNFFTKPTASYATSEGIVDGVAKGTAKYGEDLAIATVAAILTGYGKAFSWPISQGVKPVVNHYSATFERLTRGAGLPMG
ncbi:MAG: RHS repeat-associated core domain-containing protein, partial [Methanomassiliicoccus sp.]|nr:RHS repeat-associated core domain-containing protein [Methanomassiliicoccus sp.]